MYLKILNFESDCAYLCKIGIFANSPNLAQPQPLSTYFYNETWFWTTKQHQTMTQFQSLFFPPHFSFVRSSEECWTFAFFFGFLFKKSKFGELEVFQILVSTKLFLSDLHRMCSQNFNVQYDQKVKNRKQKGNAKLVIKKESWKCNKTAQFTLLVSLLSVSGKIAVIVVDFDVSISSSIISYLKSIFPIKIFPTNCKR